MLCFLPCSKYPPSKTLNFSFSYMKIFLLSDKWSMDHPGRVQNMTFIWCNWHALSIGCAIYISGIGSDRLLSFTAFYLHSASNTKWCVGEWPLETEDQFEENEAKTKYEMFMYINYHELSPVATHNAVTPMEIYS